MVRRITSADPEGLGRLFARTGLDRATVQCWVMNGLSRGHSRRVLAAYDRAVRDEVASRTIA